MLKLKQFQYNKKIVGRTDQLSQEAKEKITQDNVLCAHAELSALVNATHYKNHHLHSEPLANRRTVLYETVDVIRYMMATLNTWGITSSDFEKAFEKKDVYLNKHYELQQKKWEGQPVAIVDIDDVLANFRSGFSAWLKNNFNVKADVDSKEYYFITALSKINLNSETINFLSGDSVVAAQPLFQVEGQGSIPVSPLQLEIEEISIDEAVMLNEKWHSRLPKITNPNMGHSICFGAIFKNCFLITVIRTYIKFYTK